MNSPEMSFIEGMLNQTQSKENKVTEIEIFDRYKKLKWGKDFITDNSGQIILLGGRRGAKTTTFAAKIGWTDLFFKPEMNDSFIYYAAKTFDHAMALMWKKLLNFRDFFEIEDWNMNQESKGIIKTPRTTIQILGFNDTDSIGKAFGQPFKLFGIDECQEIRSDILKAAVRDASSWGTFDASGTVALLGNPPKNKYHFFSQEWLGNRYPRYHTNIYKNPFKTKEEKDDFIQEQRRIRGEIAGQETPEFRRMAFGDVVFEASNTVFNITEKNYYIKKPQQLYPIIGVDLGWRAHDAIAVLGWNKIHKDVPGKTYLLEEHQHKRQSFQELGEQVDRIAEKYNCSTIIMDTGGLAQKAIPDLTARFSKRHWIPAEKKNKNAWIKLLQTEIIHERFLLKHDAEFLKEIPLIEWREDKEGLNEKLHHSDLLDAILYGMRYCLTNLKDIIAEGDKTRLWDSTKKKLAGLQGSTDDTWAGIGDDDW